VTTGSNLVRWSPRTIGTSALNRGCQLTQAGGGLGFSSTRVLDGEGAMPQYNFLCRACKKEFSKVLTLSGHEKGGIVCPHCKSKDVEQRWAAFFAVTQGRARRESLDTELLPGTASMAPGLYRAMAASVLSNPSGHLIWTYSRSTCWGAED